MTWAKIFSKKYAPSGLKEQSKKLHGCIDKKSKHTGLFMDSLIKKMKETKTATEKISMCVHREKERLE